MAKPDLIFSTQAWEDYLYWQKTDKKKLKRIHRLSRETFREPHDGLGKPEPSKHALAGLGRVRGGRRGVFFGWRPDRGGCYDSVMDSDRLEALRRAVAPVAEAQPGLQGLYLFGSYLTDEEYEDSDVDIGALFEYGRDTKIQEIVRLQDRLEEALGRKVDLIDAGHCNAFLALDVIRGERIYEGDGLAMDLFDLYVMRRAGDLAPFERERRRMLLEEGLT